MGPKRAEVVPPPIVVAAVVTGVLELEERLGVVLVRSLAQGALGRVELRRRLRHQYRLGVRDLFLGEQLGLGLYAAETIDAIGESARAQTGTNLFMFCRCSKYSYSVSG